ncbi:sigma-70 RNA polymerase sigma factor region 4 domain-containing protein [Lactovum odontotermitis]
MTENFDKNFNLGFSASFDEQFRKFLPIVYKARKRYKIHLWEINDYIQEGMIIFFELKEAGISAELLPIYFKVRLNQHLIDLIRRQNAYKRKLSVGNYVDLSVIADHVADESYVIDSQLLITDTMTSFIAQLKKNDRQLLLKLIEGKEINRAQKSRLRQKLLKFLETDGD